MPTDPLKWAEVDLNFAYNWNKTHPNDPTTCHLSSDKAAALVSELDRLRKQLAECKQTIEDVATG